MTTFMEIDMPALLAWRFPGENASAITQPVLYVGGSDSGPCFDQARDLTLRRLPHAEVAVLPGADHSFATTHARELAVVLERFLRAHPIR